LAGVSLAKRAKARRSIGNAGSGKFAPIWASALKPERRGSAIFPRIAARVTEASVALARAATE